MIKTKLDYPCLPCAIYFLEMYAKNNAKKTRLTSHLSPKRRKTIPPYVENDSPALPIGHGGSKKKFVNFTDSTTDERVSQHVDHL